MIGGKVFLKHKVRASVEVEITKSLGKKGDIEGSDLVSQIRSPFIDGNAEKRTVAHGTAPRFLG
jgi:hypothetical protein